MLKTLLTTITRLSLKFKWVTIIGTVIFLVLGILAASQMNQELMPNIEFPQTFIIVFRPGASSEDLRDLVTIPLEQEVVKINGILPEGLESTTTSPVAFLIVRNNYGLNQATIRDQLQAVLDKVAAEDVPSGLMTTADLTPEIVKKVLGRAPSMWKHFKGEHLLAMSPDVLQAAFEVNPTFINDIDLLTRDQLAAVRVSAIVTEQNTAHEPVELPSAWALTEEQLPRLNSFSLSDIPVLSSSVFSSSPTMTPQALREFVENEIVRRLETIEGVAKVNIAGGQQIPQEVIDSAVASVAKADKVDTTKEPVTSNKPANNTSSDQPATTPSQESPAPILPASWRSVLVTVPMQLQVQVIVDFRSAEGLLNGTSGTGEKLKASEILNKIADNRNYANLLRDLTPEVLAYLRENESDFLGNLSEKTLENLAAVSLNAGSWQQLLNQEGFKAVKTIADLRQLKGSVAGTLNALVASTPAEFNTFAIRLIDSLSPETVAYVISVEPDFLTTIDPQVLRYMASETLASLPQSFWDGLTDDTLKGDLQAIAADPGKEAAAAFESSESSATVADDPNAPPLPESWTKALAQFGITAITANDLLKKPFNMTAGQFMNQAASSPGGKQMIGELSAEVFLYLQGKDATFFDTLSASTISMFSETALASLPASIQARSETGPTFTPESSITRTNSSESLTISIFKTSEANTVVVSDRIEEAFKEIHNDFPDINVTPIFEQASFIKESISGVAREGGLGALMAVIVILLFLNFSVRSTLVTAVSIPTSVAIAFVLMRWLPGSVNQFLMQPGVNLPEGIETFLLRLFPASITLNIMTLSGLTVAIGRVVDDSIVVLENIYRQIQSGTDSRQAVLKGTRDVSLAIFAATLTTVVVFLPIGLTGGIVGEFFMPFGLAVTYSLGASFIVAITLVPLLAYLFIKPNNIPQEKEGLLESTYHSIIEWSLRHRFIILGAAFVTLIFGMWLLATRPSTFLPSFGEPQITVAVTLPTGTRMAVTDVRVRQFEDYLKTLTDRGVTKYQTQIGSGGGLSAFFGGGGISENAAQITIAVDMKSGEALNNLTQEIRSQAETTFGKSNARVSKASMSEQGFGGFSIVVTGPEESIRNSRDDIVTALLSVPELTNVTSTLDQLGEARAYLRINQTTAVTFTGELETQDTLGVTNKAIEAVKNLKTLPPDITISQGFQSQQQTEGFAQMFTSMIIAITIVYLVMVLTFGTLLHPFTILFSLPLAVVGAALGLTMTNRVLGISALIGMLMLIGIVVTNAIVLIDRVQANRKERGMSTHDALVEGGRTRLRPILMTAIATVFALLPLAIGLSEGAIIASELGTVVIGGLFSSTLLTLMVVPVVYSLFEQIQSVVFGRTWRSKQNLQTVSDD